VTTVEPFDEELGYRRVVTNEVMRFMQDEVVSCNQVHGWYEEGRTFGDDIALLHSEASEALEAFRTHGAHDVTGSDLPHGDGVILAKPEGVGSEFADVLIRLMDTCDRYDIDLFAEWRRKMDYNWTRPYKHGGRAL
jgi:NTP pyrophosphatase (non-canonical NTP hydrolase)